MLKIKKKIDWLFITVAHYIERSFQLWTLINRKEFMFFKTFYLGMGQFWFLDFISSLGNEEIDNYR